ncbi:DNA/RNA non-specific endonuclease [Roseomonas sp. NAR14]|uniref:Endonuclease n=1 Tax=Roseomonas acroporae TaxID=2937791 RepID=A0A9X1Y7V0_9PROT|nr:DNA/RNA non-specific endonuclease [Roseomonas acroporae]MCK8785106.1 DNA/RNA non-specific endonuclease [Roseomonas acroporae]
MRLPRALLRLAALLAPLLLAPLLLALPAAAATACPEHYADGEPPRIVRPQLARDVVELCFEAYAVLHSGVSRTGLAAAEHLTRDRLQAARRVSRENAFREEDRLPADQRARLSDYARSGFDRGHLAPAGDMPSRDSQAESFSLANMVPQAPASNRCLWEGIESAVRDLVMREGEAFVVTGPIFLGDTLRRLNGRVLVPTHLFKAVYLPGRGAAAYVAPNDASRDWRAVSLAELRDLAGIAAFPSLPDSAQAAAIALPEPRPHNIEGACERAVTTASSQPEARPRATPAPAPPAARPAPARVQTSTLTLIVAALFAVVAILLLLRALGRR